MITVRFSLKTVKYQDILLPVCLFWSTWHVRTKIHRYLLFLFSHGDATRTKMFAGESRYVSPTGSPLLVTLHTVKVCSGIANKDIFTPLLETRSWSCRTLFQTSLLKLHSPAECIRSPFPCCHMFTSHPLKTRGLKQSRSLHDLQLKARISVFSSQSTAFEFSGG